MTSHLMRPLWLAVVLTAFCAAAGEAQPKVRRLSEQDLVDMLQGASIQASRANNTETMVQRLKAALAGRRLTMIAVEDVPDDWTIVSGGGIGGGGAWEYVRERTAKQQLPTIPNAQSQALKALSTHIGRPFNAVIRVEAAGAALTAMLVAAELGVPMVDACMSARARPEVQQSIPWINGISAAPMALVSRWGDEVVIDKTADDYRMEDLGRAVAVASGGGASAALSMSAQELKRGVIRGSLTEALTLGRAVRQAREQGRDPVDALVKAAGGFKLFQGMVTKADMKGDRGFTWWDVELAGTGPYRGHTYTIFVKNENIVTWLDGKPDAMSPDFIQNINPKTGDSTVAKQLGGYEVGQEVAIIGWPSSPMWRTPKGIEVFGPRHFGFDFDYVPIEQLQKARTSAR
ncbi:MAG: DUF917 domain-containing protein [Acidobacteria bacterium]|nr:DUF917 domain-containing protein [Acidobacteriota bacterium]